MAIKLEEASWRTLAIKLTTNTFKVQSGQLEPMHLERILHAVQRKQQIENERYIEDRSSNQGAHAPN